jgi:chaperonin GroES
MGQQTEKKLSIHPLGNRVVAQRTEQEETLKGGIILPDSAKKKPESAKVIAVGPGAMSEDGKLLPMPVAVGDTILMDKYAGQEVTINDEDYVIVKADDIVAIIN